MPAIFATPSSTGLDTRVFRSVAGTFATGITIITCSFDEEPYGCAANAVLSVSLDPPLMLISLAHQSKTRHSILASGAFAINILPDTAAGRSLCATFAASGTDKFSNVEYEHGDSGVPVLSEALGWITCTVDGTNAAGDHDLILGRVNSAEERLGDPLLFFRGEQRTLAS